MVQCRRPGRDPLSSTQVRKPSLPARFDWGRTNFKCAMLPLGGLSSDRRRMICLFLLSDTPALSGQCGFNGAPIKFTSTAAGPCFVLIKSTPHGVRKCFVCRGRERLAATFWTPNSRSHTMRPPQHGSQLAKAKRPPSDPHGAKSFKNRLKTGVQFKCQISTNEG